MTASLLHERAEASPDGELPPGGEPSGEAASLAESLAPARLLERGTAFEQHLLGAQLPAMPLASRERLARALQLPDVVVDDAVTPDGGPSGASAVSSGAVPPGAVPPGAVPPTAVPPDAAAAGALARWSKLATVAVLGGVMLGVPPLASRWLAAQPDDAARFAEVEQPLRGAAQVGQQEPAHGAVREHSAGAERSPNAGDTEPRQRREPEPAAVPAKRPELARSGARRTGSRATKPVADHGSDRGLSAELRALERSQHALASGRSAEAQQALDGYAARFPRGELTTEAELLQIDVLMARGEHRRARELAHALSLRKDAARYRGRLQALLSNAPSAAAGGHQGGEKK